MGYPWATEQLFHVSFGMVSYEGQTLATREGHVVYLEDLLNNNAVASAIPMYPTCKDYPTMLADTISYDLERTKLILDNFGIKDSNGRTLKMNRSKRL